MFWLPLLAVLFISSCGQDDSSSILKTQNKYTSNPLYEVRFEKNIGQTDPEVAFVGKGTGYNLFFTKNRMVFDVTLKIGGQEENSYISAIGTRISQTESYAFEIKLVGSNLNPIIQGAGEHDGFANYYIGPKEQWVSNVPRFEQVKYKSIYPGVDLVFYGTGGNIEHDFIVSPGVDPSIIRVMLNGVKALSLTDYGDLKIKLTQTDNFTFKNPVAYQIINGRRIDVSARYEISGTSFGFKLGHYNPEYELVIDPTATLPASTLVGPTTSNDNITMDIATDGTSYYVVGYTKGGSFPSPITANGTPSAGGNLDAFIFKINSSLNQGTTPTVTYFGGTGDDFATSLSISGTSVFVSGYTNTQSAIGPGCSGATAPVSATNNGASGTYDAFIASFSTTLSTPTNFCYMGGSGFESSMNIAATSTTAFTITGTTSTSGLSGFGTFGGVTDAYIARFSSITTIANATYVGGADRDTGTGVQVDSSGNVYFVGEMRSSSITVPTGTATVNTVLKSCASKTAPKTGDFQDLLLGKFTSTLGVNWYGCFGGSGGDYSGGLALDTVATGCTTAGQACIDLLMYSNSSITANNAYQSSAGGGYDLVVGKLPGTSGTTPPASTNFLTYLGGTGDEQARGTSAISVDGNGGIWVVGRTNSSSSLVSTSTLPVNQTTPFTTNLSTYPGASSSGVVARFGPEGGLSFISYLGGTTSGAFDEAAAVFSSTTSNLSTAYIVGNAYSSNFPTGVSSGTTYSTTHSTGTISQGFISQVRTSDVKLVNNTTNSAAATSLTLTLPSGTVSGDYVIAAVGSRRTSNNPGVIGISSGLAMGTALTAPSALTGTNRCRLSIYGKRIVGADGSTVTFGSTNASNMVGVMLTFRSVAQTNPTDTITPTTASRTTASSAALAIPTMTPATALDLLLACYLACNGGAAWGTPGSPASQTSVTMGIANQIASTASIMCGTSTDTTTLLTNSATGTISATPGASITGAAAGLVLKQQ